MAVNLSRSAALLCAMNHHAPSMAVRGGRKIVQLPSAQLRSGAVKSVPRCSTTVGEAAEEIKEGDRDSLNDESEAAPPKKERVILYFLIPPSFLQLEFCRRNGNIEILSIFAVISFRAY